LTSFLLHSTGLVLPDFEDQVLPVELLEALQAGGRFVRTRYETAGDERAVVTCERLAKHPRHAVGEPYRPPRQRPTLGIDHAPAEFGRSLLSQERDRHQ